MLNGLCPDSARSSRAHTSVEGRVEADEVTARRYRRSVHDSSWRIAPRAPARIHRDASIEIVHGWPPPPSAISSGLSSVDGDVRIVDETGPIDSRLLTLGLGPRPISTLIASRCFDVIAPW
jgi:hypothetical protein